MGSNEIVTKPDEVIADAAYDNKEIREYLQRKNTHNNIGVNNRNQKKITCESTHGRRVVQEKQKLHRKVQQLDKDEIQKNRS